MLSDIIRDKGDDTMDNIMANITTVLTVVFGLFAIKRITGFIFKLLFIAVLGGFIYYVYTGGDLEVIKSFLG